MITTSQMYWLTRLEGVVTFFQVMAFIIGVVVVSLLIGGTFRYFANIEFGNDDKDVKLAKILLGLVAKVFAPLFIVFVLLSLLVPTTKEMAAILVVPRIANSEKVQQAGNKLYELAVEWMDELKPSKKKEGAEK